MPPVIPKYIGTMKIKSSAFRNGIVYGSYSKLGENRQPSITIINPPEDTLRYEVKMLCFHNQEDEMPEARVKLQDGTLVLPWIHWWIILKARDSKNNLITFFPERIPNNLIIKCYPNSWGNTKYDGPKPPINQRHKYHLVVTAKGLHNKSLASAEITGYYTRGLPR